MAVNGKQNQGVTHGVTASKFRVTLTVEGNDWGVWDKKTGGRLASNVTTYNPGGLAPQVVLTGNQTVDTVQLQRLYDLLRDHDNLAELYAAVGGGKCVVKEMPLDNDGNAYGGRGAIVWTGVIQDVTAPDPDSNSNDAALVILTIAPNGHPTVS